jgi:glutathione peroxidase
MKMISLSIVAVSVLSLVFVAAATTTSEESPATMPGVLEFTMKSLTGDSVDLNQYLGKAVLIVNVASECGYTYQYEGLQNLHNRYAADGLAILGFPSNDFGRQEPGSAGEIQDFCERNYGVRFDMFSKVVVSGQNKVPLYDLLTSYRDAPGEVEWNFEKFLIGRDGEILNRFRSAVEPESREMVRAIEAAVAAK